MRRSANKFCEVNKVMSLEKVEALEQRINKVVEMVRGLKEEKGRLEEEVSTLRGQLASKGQLEEELTRLREEKEQVKDRLENVLRGIEELSL